MNAARSTTLTGESWLGISLQAGDVRVEIEPVKPTKADPKDGPHDYDAAVLGEATKLKFCGRVLK